MVSQKVSQYLTISLAHAPISQNMRSNVLEWCYKVEGKGISIQFIEIEILYTHGVVCVDFLAFLVAYWCMW